MHRLVREHRRSRDVADGEDVRHVGAHLRIDLDEAALGDCDARRHGADVLAVRRAPHRDQHQIVGLRRLGRGVALEPDLDAVLLDFRFRGPGLQHHVVEAGGIELLPYRDQVPVRTEHEAVQHLDHVQPRAEARVHRTHFQADDPAADHQHALGHGLERERAGRIYDARILGQERQLRRLRAGGDDRALEMDRFRAILCFNLQAICIREASDALNHRDLARLRHPRQPAGELADDLVLEPAQLVEVELRLAEIDAVRRERPCRIGDRRGVQQRLGRNAADVQAHAAERGIALDQQRRQSQIGGAEGCRVASGASTPGPRDRTRCRRRQRSTAARRVRAWRQAARAAPASRRLRGSAPASPRTACRRP